MKEKLLEIIEHQEIELSRHQTEMDSINSRLMFMSEHKFENELRFLKEKKAAMLEIFLDYKKSTIDLRSLIDAWNS